MSSIHGIDHTVVMAESLEEAALTAHRLGFVTTPAARHPFGTGNVLVQLQGSYLEYLALLDESLFPEDAPGRFSFPSFNRDFLIGEGAGISMLALKTGDPEALQRQWAETGLSTVPPFSFERTARAPDGRDLPVSFTLAFASHADLVRAGVFALTHHHAPENFWHAAYQAHPNTAVRMAGVTLVAPDPDRAASTLSALVGGSVEPAADALILPLSDGAVLEVMGPAAFAARFGSDRFGDTRIPRFAAMTIAVADTAATRAVLERNGIPASETGNGLTVPPEEAGGAGYQFVPDDAA